MAAGRTTAKKSTAVKKPTTRVELITPEMAEKYLDRNTHNRTLRQARIDNLVAAIQRGEWIMNGDAIRFDKDGTLADGQHRLWAIALSGVPCESVVIEGLDVEAQSTMDTGARRNLKDTLQLAGHGSAANLAAALNYLWKMENGKVREMQAKPTIAQAMKLLEENPTLPDSMKVASQYKARFRGSYGMVTALHYTFASIESEDAEEFFDKLIGGVALEEKNPIYVLRSWLEKLNQGQYGGQRNSIIITHAMIVKAWNFWRDGEQVQRISWKASGLKAEPLPEPH